MNLGDCGDDRDDICERCGAHGPDGSMVVDPDDRYMRFCEGECFEAGRVLDMLNDLFPEYVYEDEVGGAIVVRGAVLA